MSPEISKTPEKQGIVVDVGKEVARRTKILKKAGELSSKATLLKSEAGIAEHAARKKRAEASKPLFPSNITVKPNKDTKLNATRYTRKTIGGANAGTHESGKQSVTSKKPFLAERNYVNLEKGVVVFRHHHDEWEDSLSGDGEDVWVSLEVPFDQLEMVEITEQEPTK